MARFSDEQVGALIEGPKRFRVVEFPGRAGLTVAVRCLTEAELDRCRTDAQIGIREVCRPRGWDPASAVQVDPEALEQRAKRARIWRAFYDAETIASDKPVPFFETPEDVGELDSATVDALELAYLEHQEWVNPVQDLADDEQAEILLEALKKGSTPEVLLSAFGPSTPLRLLIFMVSKARKET